MNKNNPINVLLCNDRYKCNMSLFTFKSACTDTPFWNSGNGYNCMDFENFFCEDGRFRYGAFQNYAGERFNYPEQNCVACGKCSGGKFIGNINI